VARWAAWLYAVAGALALVSLQLPAREPRAGALVAVLAIADLAVAAAIVRVRADAWTVRRLALIAVAGLVLASLFAMTGAVPSFGHPTFFLVLLVWIGLAPPRGGGSLLAIPAAIAYALPPILRDGPPELVASVVVAVPLMVLIAEVGAAVVDRLDRLNHQRGAGPRARDVAERIAAAWGAVDGLPTLSIGIALHDADASTADTVSRADRALYDAKRAGRDRIRLAEPAVALA
jgi:hypothetical protein